MTGAYALTETHVAGAIDPSTLAARAREQVATLHFSDPGTAAYHAHVHTREIAPADLVPGSNEVETYLNTAREGVRSGTPSAPVRRQERIVVDHIQPWERRNDCECHTRGHRHDRDVYSKCIPMSELLDQLMARAESALTALQSTFDGGAAPLALQFGHDIGAIGRELTMHPGLAPDIRAFVERTAQIVERDTGLSSWFGRVYDAADSRSSETLEYVRALHMRSDLEFFRDLYRDSAASHRVSGIETDFTDENLKEWGGQQYLEEIPPGLPASHVWWHQSLSGT